jgi:hypothetical protein
MDVTTNFTLQRLYLPKKARLEPVGWEVWWASETVLNLMTKI